MGQGDFLGGGPLNLRDYANLCSSVHKSWDLSPRG